MEAQTLPGSYLNTRALRVDVIAFSLKPGLLAAPSLAENRGTTNLTGRRDSG